MVASRPLWGGNGRFIAGIAALLSDDGKARSAASKTNGMVEIYAVFTPIYTTFQVKNYFRIFGCQNFQSHLLEPEQSQTFPTSLFHRV